MTRVRSVVLDCPDPPALASFYAALLGGRAETGDPDWCVVHLAEPPLKLAFQRVTPYLAPEWPDGRPQQLHLDLTVPDLDAASRHALSLGATALTGPVEEPGGVFIVHADLAGHPFCLFMERATAAATAASLEPDAASSGAADGETAGQQDVGGGKRAPHPRHDPGAGQYLLAHRGGEDSVQAPRDSPALIV